MTDIGAHQLDIVQWLGGVDAPKSVVANGGIYHFKHWETPDVIHGVWDYGKFAATFAVEFVNGYDGVGATFYGTKKTLACRRRGRRRIRVYDTIDKPTAEPEAEDGVEGRERDAAARQELGGGVKANKDPNSPIELGHQVITAAHLANMAYRTGKKIVWDAAEGTGRSVVTRGARMFIFEKAPFPSCHASTLVEHEPGKLLAAWFGGKDEGAKDVQIWASTFDGKKWGELSVLGTEPGQPCWNPVLFKTAKGTLYLWYKAGPSPIRWTGYVRMSTDDGKTWTKPEMMPAGFFGPVRAKPIQLANGTILAGTSLESYRNWTPFVDRSTDDGKTWVRSNPFPMPGKFNQIQPTLFEAKDGRVVALMRSRDPRKICRSESKDGGKTFTPAEETDSRTPVPASTCVKTKAGDVFLIYNPVGDGANADQPRPLDRRREDLEEGRRPGDRARRVLVPGDDRVRSRERWRSPTPGGGRTSST